MDRTSPKSLGLALVRGLARTCTSQGRRTSSKPRSLRVELLEGGQLLSIAPFPVGWDLPADTHATQPAEAGARASLITLPWIDDHGNTFERATRLTLARHGSGAQNGRIERSGDVDMFRFVAPVSGRMTIGQAAAAGSRLDSYLYACDAQRQELAKNDDSEGSLNSRVEIDVTQGATYYVKAAAFSCSTGGYTLQFATSTVDPSRFNIQLALSGLTQSQQNVVRQAARRWEEVILGDLPDVQYNGQTIDDVWIDVRVAAIDVAGNGVFNIFAYAGYYSDGLRSDGSSLPFRGFVVIDSADVGWLEASGELPCLVQHEIGHVLGFGTIWSNLSLLTGTDTVDARFTGAQATAEYNAIFGRNDSSVPVENDPRHLPGTRLSHWREAEFDTELMTGLDDPGANPLSRITVASMADLGYQVNLNAADNYAPPAVRPASGNASGAAMGTDRARQASFASSADWHALAVAFDQMATESPRRRPVPAHAHQMLDCPLLFVE